MIEVEKNFDLREGDKGRVTEGARLIAAKTFTDVYYDTPEYYLTGRDFWLRTRDGEFQLKVPLNREKIAERVSDQYRELETEEEIVRELGVTLQGSLAETLKTLGYKPFARIVTSRESWEREGFHLDFDEMDYGFSAFEIELMVEKVEDIAGAEQRILDFGKKFGLAPSTDGRGKVIEYLFRNDRKHYEFLVKRGKVPQ